MGRADFYDGLLREAHLHRSAQLSIFAFCAKDPDTAERLSATLAALARREDLDPEIDVRLAEIRHVDVRAAYLTRVRRDPAVVERLLTGERRTSLVKALAVQAKHHGTLSAPALEFIARVGGPKEIHEMLQSYTRLPQPLRIALVEMMARTPKALSSNYSTLTGDQELTELALAIAAERGCRLDILGIINDHNLRLTPSVCDSLLTLVHVLEERVTAAQNKVDPESDLVAMRSVLERLLKRAVVPMAYRERFCVAAGIEFEEKSDPASPEALPALCEACSDPVELRRYFEAAVRAEADHEDLTMAVARAIGANTAAPYALTCSIDTALKGNDKIAFLETLPPAVLGRMIASGRVSQAYAGRHPQADVVGDFLLEAAITGSYEDSFGDAVSMEERIRSSVIRESRRMTEEQLGRLPLYLAISEGLGQRVAGYVLAQLGGDEASFEVFDALLDDPNQTINVDGAVVIARGAVRDHAMELVD